MQQSHRLLIYVLFSSIFRRPKQLAFVDIMLLEFVALAIHSFVRLVCLFALMPFTIFMYSNGLYAHTQVSIHRYTFPKIKQKNMNRLRLLPTEIRSKCRVLLYEICSGLFMVKLFSVALLCSLVCLCTRVHNLLLSLVFCFICDSNELKRKIVFVHSRMFSVFFRFFHSVH